MTTVPAASSNCGFGLMVAVTKSPGSVELLDVFQVVAEANRVGRLAGLGANHLLQRVGRELMIARPLQALQLVLLAGRDGEGDIDDGLVARAVFGFGSRLLHDFRLRLAELRLQISALVINRKKLSLDELSSGGCGSIRGREASRPAASSAGRSAAAAPVNSMFRTRMRTSFTW